MNSRNTPYSHPPADYTNLVPELPELTDFIDPSSDDDEEEVEESTVTRVGEEYQVQPPRYGTVTYSSNYTRMIWDSKRLQPEIVDKYLEDAEKHWPSSYINKHVQFNEPDALKVLHIKNYKPQAALEAIVNQRLPYIVLVEYDRTRKQEDIRALKNGEDLGFNEQMSN